ncbi:ABC transporter permease [Sulfurimonas sp.]
MRKTFFALSLGIFLLFGFLPLLFVAYESFFRDGSFSLDTYITLFTSSTKLLLLAKTFFLALCVTLLTLFVGTLLGIVIAKTDIKAKKLFLTLFLLPLLLPPYTIALAFSHLFGEWFFSFWGLLFVEFCIYLPLPLFATVILLRSINPQLENAARLLMSWRETLRYVTLPLIVPSLLFIATIVFLLSFSNYSVANFLRYNTFILSSFVEFSAFYHYNDSFVLSFIFLAFVLFLFAFEHSYMKRHNFTKGIKNLHFENKNMIEIGYKKTIFFFMLLFALFVSLLPIFLLMLDVPSLQIYLQAFELAKESIFRSFFYAFVGGLGITFFGFIFAYVIHTKLLGFSTLFEILTLTLFALPSILVGIALVMFFNHPWSNFIYASSALLLIGYVVKYTFVSSQIFLANLRQIPPSMEESGEILGISWWQRIFYIVVPLLKNSLLLSFVISFIFILRDTDLSMILYSAGAETLAIKTFTLMANSPAELISALNLIMVAMVLLVLSFLKGIK